MFFTSSNGLCDQHQMWSDLANQWRVPRQSKHPVALSPIRRCNGLRGANFDIVVVHFAFAANKTLQWLKWHNFDISCRPLSLCYQHLGEAHRDGPRRDGGRPDSKSRFPVAQSRRERLVAQGRFKKVQGNMDEKYMFELLFFLKKLESKDQKMLAKLIETNPAGTAADLTQEQVSSCTRPL